MKRWPTDPDDWYRLRPLARELRREQTEAEKALWAAIRERKVAGFRFQRQRVFQKHIVDFYCPEARLVIEVDGPIHDRQKDKDANRQAHGTSPPAFAGAHLSIPPNDRRAGEMNTLSRCHGLTPGGRSSLLPSRRQVGGMEKEGAHAAVGVGG